MKMNQPPSPSSSAFTIKSTFPTMNVVKCWCLIVLICGFASLATSDDTSASSSSSSSSSASKVQAVSSATTETPAYQLSSWEVFSSEIKMIAGLIGDTNACKDEILEKTQTCYTDLKDKWDNGGTEKRFCCFAQDVLDCFYDLVPTYCDEKGTAAYLSPEKQELMYFSASSDSCGNYHSFWHCDNGIPIVVGSSCALLVIIILVVGGVIYYLRKRRGTSSLNRGDNL